MKKETIAKQKKKKKRFRIKFKVVLIVFFLLYIIGHIIYNFIDQPISNIYISGNLYLSDWNVIELAELDDYPATLLNSTKTIEERLEKNELINSVTVKKKKFKIVYIDITENRPIFYDQIYKKTVLIDKTQIDRQYDVPILNSTITSTKIYDEFVNAMKDIPIDVLNKMSEITFSPDDVDKERYLITMTDGNYVYVTLKKFNAINLYNDYVKKFDNKKGILYLNSGGYFKIMEN